MSDEKKATWRLFLEWRTLDVLQTLLFVGWTACVVIVLSGEHLLTGLLIGSFFVLNYSFLAIYHVNSIGATGPERVKNVGLIYLAPSIFMGILAILSLASSGGK